jgi:hypothetical protein
MVSLVASPALAQVVVTDTYLPASNIKLANPPPGEGATLAMNLLDVRAELPVYARRDERKRPETLVLVAPNFRHHALYLDLPPGDDEYFPKGLYAAGLEVAVMQSFSKSWYGVAFGSGAVASDFEDLDDRHLLFEGGGFGVYRITDAFHVGAGPVFTFAFGHPLLIPAPFVRYEGAGKWQFRMHFPRFLKLTYAISDRFELGLAARSLYNNYRLGDERARDPNGDSPVIVFSDLTVGLEAGVRVWGPLWLNAGAGVTASRQFSVEDDDQNELFNREMENTMLATAGLEVRL